ncbi:MULTISPECIES: prenyltransferase [unclassified Colwellia]|uniref:prenyltransferase n=1 Tax=unclassified Colwellia TaxID=196834 RepID=UPI0015F6A8C6|nr:MULTISPECIES: prenyltransferase [unclassified Colwellia]MBA6254973.1 prenyltransferase [Colwellia sp. MB3u-28]MBA6259076.1 prenyltransferase [Colwellia sp. MB3u-41]
MKLATIIPSFRVPFLVLAPICVFLGASISYKEQGAIDFCLLAIVMLGGILAHIGVNTLNEYQDYQSGLDLKTMRPPFSGGSGLLCRQPELLPWVKTAAIVSTLLTLFIGFYFIYLHGLAIMPLIPIGVLGLAIIVSYTKWINKRPLICLVAPGLSFGLLMVAGTQLVLSGHFSSTPWVIGVIPFFLINNLLLLNQYPDIDADKSIGRNHFPIAFGIKASNSIFALFSVCSTLLILFYISQNILPALSALALIPQMLAYIALYGAIKFGASIGQQPKYLAYNIACTLLTPLTIAITVFIN